jgi:hypothetical protein
MAFTPKNPPMGSKESSKDRKFGPGILFAEVKQCKKLPEILIKTLPSGFIPYPKGCTIKYQPYTFGDLNRFNQSKLAMRDRVDQVISGIFTSFDKNLLTFSDFLFIGLLRKISTFGSHRFSVRFRCPKCKNIVNADLNPTELEFDDLKAPELPIVFTMGSNAELHFTPLTVLDYIKLSELGLEDDTIASLAIQVRNRPFDEAKELISAATGADILHINDIDKLLFHGLKPVHIRCTAKIKSDKEDGEEVPCRQLVKVDLQEDDDLIYPFRSDENASGDAIRFGI